VRNARSIVQIEELKYKIMSIEKFLSDFDEHNKRKSDAKTREALAKEKQKADDENYLAEFKEYYENVVVPELKAIDKKLGDRFHLNYSDSPEMLQANSYFSKIQIVPNFEHFITEINVQISAEGGRRLVTLSGTPSSKNGRSSTDGTLSFQDVMEAFKKINLEEEISKILEKSFVKG